MFRSVMRDELIGYFGISEKQIEKYVDDFSCFADDVNTFPSMVVMIRHAYFSASSAEDFLQEVNELCNIETPVSIDEELNDEELLVRYLVACNKGEAVSSDVLVQLGLRAFSEVKSQLERDISSFETRKYAGKVMLMADVFCEIRGLLTHLRSHNDSELDVAKVGSFLRRAQQCPTRDIYGLAREQISYSFYFGQPVVPQLAFSIRQAIEVKIKESLGIALEVQNKDANRVAISRLLSFCEKCAKNNSLRFPISLKLLIEINKWTNCYVHSGYVHFPYFIIERIVSKLELFFFPEDGHVNTPEGVMCMPFGPTVQISEQYSNEQLHRDLRKYFKEQGKKMKLCSPKLAVAR